MKPPIAPSAPIALMAAIAVTGSTVEKHAAVGAAGTAGKRLDSHAGAEARQITSVAARADCAGERESSCSFAAAAIAGA